MLRLGNPQCNKTNNLNKRRKRRKKREKKIIKKIMKKRIIKIRTLFTDNYK